jgi:hypothetical protein
VDLHETGQTQEGLRGKTFARSGRVNSDIRECIKGWENEGAPGPWGWMLRVIDAAEQMVHIAGTVRPGELDAVRKVQDYAEKLRSTLNDAEWRALVSDD